MTDLATTIALGLVIACCWIMALYKTFDLLYDKANVALRWLWLALLASTAAVSIQTIAYPTNLPRQGRLLAHVVAELLSILACAAAQSYLLRLRDPDEGARRALHRRLRAAGICVLILMTPIAIDLRGGTPLVHNIVYPTYLVWALADSIRHLRGYARIIESPLCRLGLSILLTGCAVGIGGITFQALAITTGRPDPAVERLAASWLAVSVLILVLGATVPSWGARLRLDRVGGRVTALRMTLQIRPLWLLLRDARPQALLIPVPRRSAIALTRLTVEILDGRVWLQPWIDPLITRRARVLGRQAGIPEDELDAVAEAAALVAASAAQRSGAAPLMVDPPAVASPPCPQCASPELRHEIAWLVSVSKALRSPVVTEVTRGRRQRRIWVVA